MREIHHVALSVQNLEASRRFYGQALGLKETLNTVVSGEAVERSLKLRAGTTGKVTYFQGPTQLGQIELIEWQPNAKIVTGPKRPGDPGVFLLSIEVNKKELESIWERMIKMKVPVYSPPEEFVLENYGPITAFIVEDPDGTLIELVTLPSKEQIKRFRKNTVQ
tara:strand:- start:269 stop:760 length:492 start_codon:yes stop_codon:yes gene_type:complete